MLIFRAGPPGLPNRPSSRSSRRVTLLALTALAVLPSVCAQQYVLPGQPKPGTVSLDNNWTQQERDFFWRKTTIDPEGYLRIAGTADQVNIIEEARARNSFRSKVEAGLEPVVARIARTGFPFVGSWREDDYRLTMVFGNESTGLLMYSRFDFQKHGSSISVVKDFARFQVRGRPAVLSLTVSSDSMRGLWKFVTWRAGVAHEIYLNEEVSGRDKKPRRNSAQILRIANAILE